MEEIKEWEFLILKFSILNKKGLHAAGIKSGYPANPVFSIPNS